MYEPKFFKVWLKDGVELTIFDDNNNTSILSGGPHLGIRTDETAEDVSVFYKNSENSTNTFYMIEDNIEKMIPADIGIDPTDYRIEEPNPKPVPSTIEQVLGSKIKSIEFYE